MKTKDVILIIVVCIIVSVIASYGYSKFKKDDKDNQHIPKIAAEQENILRELGKLNKEIEVLKADVNAYKLSEKDYSKQLMEMMEKQTQLQAREETQPAKLKQSGTTPNIAIVSIRKVFQNCKKGVSYRQDAIAEQDRIIAELDKLSKEIEAQKAGLKTLKENSSEYMASAKELFEKQANYQARQEFYKQQMELKDQLWTKELYQDIIQTAGNIAKEKGLEMVFREDEVDFSETDVAELGLAMRTQKLLYSGGCSDITDEVTARLDAKK
jgi:Skp family chaperone for outer membrane proteins